MLYPLDKLESAEKIASSFSYREPLSLRATRACGTNGQSSRQRTAKKARSLAVFSASRAD